jgi:hypothetical protein
VLRDFRVLDIVTKAAEFRSTLPAAYQENGWDMPEWVRQIPVLP